MKKITLFFLLTILYAAKVFAQAPNDVACDAIDVTVNPSACSNTVYTFDDSETDEDVFSAPDCAVDMTFKDRWYKFQMPANGKAVKIVTSSTSGSSYLDPALEVFAATDSGDPCNTLVSVGCDHDGNPDQASDEFFPQIIVVEPSNTHIYFRVWYYGIADDINICLFEVDPPLMTTNGDDCSDPDDLVLSIDCSSKVLKTFFQKTDSAQADPSCASNEGSDVWFTIQVENDQFYDIALETSEDPGSNVQDTGMVVYLGTCGALTEIACDQDNGIGRFSKIDNDADLKGLKGVTLYVRVFPEDFGQTETFYICATKTVSLGVTDQMLNSFKMYPNPARDMVNLKFTQSSGSKVAIAIYNLQGKLVQVASKTSGNQNVSLPVGHLATGLYFVKLNDGTNEITKKLMVR